MTAIWNSPRQDLVRYYRDIDNGPQGIFLKKSPSGKIFFAKSWAYSLFAAPFIRVFGMNGFPVFHAVLLLLLLLMGFAYFSLSDEPIPSLLGVLTFLFASVAWVYYVWISPDFFNMCLVFTIAFLWIYKIRAAKLPPVPGEDKPGRVKRFLLSDGSDYLAAFLAGIATFSKPPNVVLMAPLFLGAVLAKRYKKAVLIVVFFLASAAFLFGMNYVLTADWNFMGGERKTFYGKFPFEKEGVTFDTTGWPMTSEGYFSRMLIPVKFIFFNIFYYFFGRFTGLAWYFFPALLFLYLFFRGRRGAGREQWTPFRGSDPRDPHLHRLHADELRWGRRLPGQPLFFKHLPPLLLPAADRTADEAPRLDLDVRRRIHSSNPPHPLPIVGQPGRPRQEVPDQSSPPGVDPLQRVPDEHQPRRVPRLFRGRPQQRGGLLPG